MSEKMRHSASTKILTRVLIILNARGPLPMTRIARYTLTEQHIIKDGLLWLVNHGLIEKGIDNFRGGITIYRITKEGRRNEKNKHPDNH